MSDKSRGTASRHVATAGSVSPASPRLTRRSFVQAGAAGAAAAAFGLAGRTHSHLAMAEPAEGTDEDGAGASQVVSPEAKRVRTVCHGCIQLCPCIAYVEDGVVVKLEGDPDAPVSKGGMCLKGMAQLHSVYSPRHVLHPMKLVGERGSNKWETISWDEAVETAAQQLANTQLKYGRYALWAAAGGGGNYVSGIAAGWPYVWGATTQMSPGAIQCYMPRCMMGGIMVSGDNQSMADSSALEMFNEYDPTMEALIIWGAQPSVSQTAQSGHGMADARAQGLKTVVIDPNFSPDAAKADVWLPVRPGSDSALALAWIRYVIEHESYDEEFCKYWTNLPFLINPETKLPYRAEEVWPDYVNPCIDPNDVYDTPAYVCFDNRTGKIQPFPYSAPEDSPVDPELFATVEVNGVEAKTAFQIYRERVEPWTLEKAAEVCWLEADAIEKALEIYVGAEHAGIVNGVFSDMQECAAAVPLGLIGLDIMMGFVNKPGCVLTNKGPSSRQTNRATGPWRLATVTYQASHNRYGLGWTLGWTKGQNDRWLEEQKQKWAEKGKDPDYMQQTAAQILKDRLGTVEHKGSYWWNQTTNPCARDAIDTGEPYRPRTLYYVSGNLLVNIGEPVKWAETLKGQDFVVQQYCNMTSFTVECADLFLPTNEWLEYDSGGMYLASQLNARFLHQKACHLGETVAPEIPAMLIVNRANEILKEHGEEVFDPDYLPEIASCYTDSAKQREIWAKNIWGAEGWDDLTARQDELIPAVTPPEQYWQYYQHLDIAENDGLPVGFGTESRKCEPYCSFFIKMARTGWPFLYPFEQEACADYDPICSYVDQTENPMTDTEYTLVMTSGRVHHWHHGTLRHSPFNRELLPAPDLRINPVTAAEYGIEDGDWVDVTSRRATTSGRAKLTEGIAPGVLCMERFWFPECFDSTQETITGGWREANVATLTFDGVVNDVFGSATYRGFQVKIAKGEKPARIWIEPEEFQPFMPILKGEPNTGEVF